MPKGRPTARATKSEGAAMSASEKRARKARVDAEFKAACARIDARLDRYLGSSWIPEKPVVICLPDRSPTLH
jgi:hypothetical protein